MIRKNSKETTTKSSVVMGGSSSRRSLLKLPRLPNKFFVPVLIGISVLVIGSVLIYMHQKNPRNISCTNDTNLINEYNDTIKQQGISKLTNIKQQIEKKKRYTSDVTCAYILMVVYYGANNSEEAIKVYDIWKKLVSQGYRVSDKVKDGVNRTNLEKFMQRLKDEKGNNSYGEG